MSVDIRWDTATSGPDGDALAEKIRDFIHDKFQQIELPRFINSVQVHSFDFGSVCPEIEIKDIGDPLPDFYEDDESDEDGFNGDDLKDDRTFRPSNTQASTRINQDRLQRLQDQILHSQGPADVSRGHRVGLRQDTFQPPYLAEHLAGLFPRSGTPGIPGGTSNIGYFNLPLGSGLSGTQTPLAAVASGTPFVPTWNHDLHASSSTHPHSNLATAFTPIYEELRHTQRSTSPTRPSTASTLPSQPSPFSPGSPQSRPNSFHPAEKVSDIPDIDGPSSPLSPRLRPPSQPEDLQVVARVTYAGDIRLTLTAEILLDYPMPSFVGIPLQLNITGLTFDGVAVLAYIRKRMHFCFLSPEDAETLTAGSGGSDGFNDSNNTTANDDDQAGASITAQPKATAAAAAHNHSNMAKSGLLQEIKVESEIGRKGDGKQSLKNVGKVEKFVLEQVRRIFEEEFVFPSFWTFLV